MVAQEVSTTTPTPEDFETARKRIAELDAQNPSYQRLLEPHRFLGGIVAVDGISMPIVSVGTDNKFLNGLDLDGQDLRPAEVSRLRSFLGGHIPRERPAVCRLEIVLADPKAPPLVAHHFPVEALRLIGSL
jgi:hypothetical protein